MPLAGAATAVLVWSLRPAADPARPVIVEEKQVVVASAEPVPQEPRSDSALAKAEAAVRPEGPALNASPRLKREGLADRALVGEQRLGRLGRQHADVIDARLVLGRQRRPVHRGATAARIAQADQPPG